MATSFSIAGNSSLAIDLGNSNTILTNNTNTPFSQPSFIVFNKQNNAVKAIGQEAYNMVGKTNGQLKVIKPLRGGVITDFDSARKMLQSMIYSTNPHKSLFGRYKNIISGVPYSTTEVERRALRDTLEQFSASNTYLLFEPLAAAIGMGIDIQQPTGNIIVDIGGGITEVVVISLSGVVNFNSIKTAGDTFDAEIQDYFRKEYKMDIGLNMAEQIKIKIGAAMHFKENAPEPVFIVGKDMVMGIPHRIKITHEEIATVLNSSISKIEQALISTLEECPPELAGDIYESGIYLTGGGSLLKGLKERLAEKIGIPIHHDPNALLSVSNGITKVLQNIDKYKAVLFK